MRFCYLFNFSFLLLFAAQAGAQTSHLDVMSYNIRYATHSDGADSWENRKAHVYALLDHYRPAIIGTQEGLHDQLKDIRLAVPRYHYVGVGRDDGKQAGEYTAIFYDKSRIRVLRDSTFWLSRQPAGPGADWDAAIQRICTFALCEDLSTQQHFWVFNTHYDHVGAVARRESSDLILRVIREQTAQAPHPVVLLGDLNAEPGSPPIEVLLRDLRDAYSASERAPYGPAGTYNGFDFAEPVRRRIDYVFVGGPWRVLQHVIIDDHYEGRYPSDHLPVWARVVLGGSR